MRTCAAFCHPIFIAKVIEEPASAVRPSCTKGVRRRAADDMNTKSQ